MEVVAVEEEEGVEGRKEKGKEEVEERAKGGRLRRPPRTSAWRSESHQSLTQRAVILSKNAKI